MIDTTELLAAMRSTLETFTGQPIFSIAIWPLDESTYCVSSVACGAPRNRWWLVSEPCSTADVRPLYDDA